MHERRRSPPDGTALAYVLTPEDADTTLIVRIAEERNVDELYGDGRRR